MATRAASPLTQHVSAVPLSSVLFLHNETKGRVGRREGGAAAAAAAAQKNEKKEVGECFCFSGGKLTTFQRGLGFARAK